MKLILSEEDIKSAVAQYVMNNCHTTLVSSADITLCDTSDNNKPIETYAEVEGDWVFKRKGADETT